MQPSAQEDTERLSINPGGLGCGECGQRRRSQRSVLRTQQCSGTVTEARPHLLPWKPLLHLPGGALLPSKLGCVGSGSSGRGGLSASSCHGGISKAASKTTCLHCLTDWSQRSIGLQPVDRAVCGGWVTRSSRAKGIGPAHLPRMQGSPKCAHQLGHLACQESDEGMSTRSHRGAWRKTPCLLA